MKAKTFGLMMNKAADSMVFKELKEYEYGMYRKFIGNQLESSDSDISEDRKPRAVERSMESVESVVPARQNKKTRTVLDE